MVKLHERTSGPDFITIYTAEFDKTDESDLSANRSVNRQFCQGREIHGHIAGWRSHAYDLRGNAARRIKVKSSK